MNDLFLNRLGDAHDEERLLAPLVTSDPSPEAITRLKGAIRRELAIASGLASRRSWTRLHGILAAAASILLAIGTAWWSARSPVASADLPFSNEFLAVASQLDGDRTILASLDEQLDSLETWSNDDAWDYGGSALYEALSHIDDDDAIDLPVAPSPS